MGGQLSGTLRSNRLRAPDANAAARTSMTLGPGEAIVFVGGKEGPGMILGLIERESQRTYSFQQNAADDYISPCYYVIQIRREFMRRPKSRKEVNNCLDFDLAVRRFAISRAVCFNIIPLFSYSDKGAPCRDISSSKTAVEMLSPLSNTWN